MPNSRISDLFKVSTLDQDVDAEALLLIARAKSHNETMQYQDFKKSITDFCVFITGDQSIAGLKTFEDNAIFNKNLSVQGNLSVRGDIFNLKFEEGVDPALLSAWQSVIYPANAEVSHNSKAWRASFQTLPSDEPEVAGVAAQGKLIVDDHDHILNGDMVTLIDPAGITHGFVESQDWSVGANKEATATNIANAINSNANFSATSDINSNEIIITQTTIGIAGNTTITVDTANPSQISKEDFSGGSGSAVSPWVDVTKKDADSYLTQLDSNLNTQGDLAVESDSHLKGTLKVDGTTDLFSNLTAHTEALFKDNLTVEKDLIVKIDGYVENDLNIGNDLTVSGDANLSQNLTVLKDLTVKETTLLEGDLQVDKTTSLNDNLTVTAAEARFIVDNAVFEKDVEIQGDLSVKGDLFNLKFDDGAGGNADNYLTQLDSNLITKGTLSVDLDSTLKSNLNTQGDVTFDQKLEVTGQTTVLDKLGVGTNNPQKTLEVAGNLRTTKTTADGGVTSLDLNSGGAADHPKLSLYDKNGGNEVNLLYSRLQFTRDAEAFISSKSDLKLVTNGQDRLTIASGGNVGIGTASPNALFEVAGETNPEIRITDTDPNSAAAGTFRAEDGGVILGAYSSHPLYLAANNTTSMTITDAGNVGIGTTSPDNKLEVKTPGGKYAFSVVDDTAPEQHLGGLFVHEDGATTDGLDLYLKQPGGSTKVAIKSNGDSYFNGGNVGIGDSSPECKLDVEEDSTGTVFRVGGTAAVGHEFQINSTQENPYVLLRGEGSDSKLQLHSSGFSYFRGGNVGIGTVSPDFKLQIKGVDDLLSLENKNNSRTLNQGINDTEAYIDFSSGDNFEIKQNGTTVFKIANGGNIEIENDVQVNNNLTVQNDLTVRGDVFNIKFDNNVIQGLPTYQSNVTYQDGDRIQYDGKIWDKTGLQGHPQHQPPGTDPSQWQEFIPTPLDDYKTHFDSDLMVVGKTGLGQEAPAARLHVTNTDNTLPIFIAESGSKHLEIENDGDVIVYNKLKIGPRDGITSTDSFQIYQDNPASVVGDQEYFSIKHTTQPAGDTGGIHFREDGKLGIGTWDTGSMLTIATQPGTTGIDIYSEVSERAMINLKESGATSYLQTGSVATLASSFHNLYGTNIGYIRSVQQDLALFSSMNGTDVHIGAGNKKLVTFTGTTDSHPSTGAEAGNDVLFSEDANVGINVAEVELSPTNNEKFKLHVQGDVKLDGRLFATDVFETYPVIPKVGDTHQGSTVTRPQYSHSAGDKGTIYFDDDYIFICTKDSDGNDPSRVAWKRFAISEW